MPKKTLPMAPQMQRPSGVSFDLSPRAMERWNPALRAADEGTSKDNTISIFDPIGYDYWTGEGVTAKRVAAALRAIGPDKDVVVNINSPGGDVFEGLAIYNLLRDHKGHVTTRVMGLAASAASFIAMAGDDRQIARAGFFMIHNAWIVCMGNRNDLRAAADWIEPFDKTLADIYAAGTGLSADEIAAQMDAETWIGGASAVEQGFADGLLTVDAVEEAGGASNALATSRRIDALLARNGMPRSERRKLIQDIHTSGKEAATPDTGTPGAAAAQDMPGAVRTVATGEVAALAASLRGLIPA